jgi:CRISPR-associated endonuclease/helicase Cas3
VLCRSLQVWQCLQHIAVPGQIRDIIEATYADREESGVLLRYADILKKKREDLQRMALLGLSRAGKTLPEEKASTRYSEQDSVEVLLIKTYQVDKQQGGVLVRFLDDTGIFLPSNGKGLQPSQQRELASKLLQNTVRVAEHLAPNPIAGNGLDWLRGYLYLGKAEGESRLRVAKVLDSGTVVSLNDGEASDRYSIQYDQYLGYQADKSSPQEHK